MNLAIGTRIRYDNKHCGFQEGVIVDVVCSSYFVSTTPHDCFFASTEDSNCWTGEEDVIAYIYKKTNYSNPIKSIKHMLQELSGAMQRLLNDSIKPQYKAGLRNGKLELTDTGKYELLEILAVQNE